MALVGGGGAPNVAGSNPAGTGTGLNYVGDHAYVSSGLIDSGTTTETTMVEFTTASESYIVGYFHLLFIRYRPGPNIQIIF